MLIPFKYLSRGLFSFGLTLGIFVMPQWYATSSFPALRISPPGSSMTPALAAAQGSNRNLSGYWSADDGATYYVLQEGNAIWWVGLSGDSGHSFANVFRGSWRTNDSVGDPADYGSVSGEWADVPRGRSLGNGTLRLSLQFSGELRKQNATGGFSASVWKRIDQADAPEITLDPIPTQSNLTGVWSTPQSGAYYVHQVGGTVWWFGLHRLGGENIIGDIYRGTMEGRRIVGTLARPPWPWINGSGTNGLVLEGDRGFASGTLTAVEDSGYYDRGTVWRRVAAVAQPR